MTGNELKAMRKKLGLTVKAASSSVGVSSRTWFRYESKVEINNATVTLFQQKNARKLNRIKRVYGET